MKYFIFLVLTKILFSQNNEYEKFQKYVQSSKGCVLSIEYSQRYFDEEVVSSGRLYLKEKMYIYDNEKQFIKYQNGFITTINKQIKQVVFDFIDSKNVTFFDVLAGNNQNIHIDASIKEKNQTRIPFSIEQWGIKGSIWINQLNGEPKKVNFIQDEDMNVDIKIKSSVNNIELILPKYDITDYEVINLIE